MDRRILIANLIPGMWLAWWLYWRIFAYNTKQTVRRESFAARAGYFLPLLIGIVLVALPSIPYPLFDTHILPRTMGRYWSGVAIVFLGLSFAIWARVHIGRNWSGTVSVKKDHELVRSGPYALVRHPIYTGLLAGILGSAIARGELRGVWALILCTVSFVIKLKSEERWMRQEFGDQYARYSAQVPCLIPFWPP